MDKDTKDKLIREQLERAGAFEELVRTRGWQFVVARYKNDLAGFINEMMSSDEPISSFENRRQSLKALKRVLAEIDNDLLSLQKYREDAKSNDNSSE